MKLPIIDTYAFPVTVPSSKKTISMRPYLVREEKLLLMAQESENVEDQTEAVAQIIRNCTNGEIEPREVPYFDVEYLLIQLRSRSVGDVVSPVYECNAIIPETNERCGHQTALEIKLEDVPVTNIDRDPESFLIKLSPKYTLKLRYPTIHTVNELLMAVLDSSEVKSEKTVNALVDIFDELFDVEDNVTYKFNDFNVAEKIEFMDRLTTSDFQKLIEFLDNMPTVTYTTTYTCARCQMQHEIILSGLVDFLA